MRTGTIIKTVCITAIGASIGVLTGLATNSPKPVPVVAETSAKDTYWEYLDDDTPTYAKDPTTDPTVISTTTAETEITPTVISKTEDISAIPKTEWRDLSDDDRYLLARMVMAEAESEPLTGQALVACVILNRVESPDFPDNIRDVIFQEGQFTPIADGRWDAVEPDDSCKAAVHLVWTGWDESQGATYFSTHETDWHRNNLTFLFEKGSHRFYK